MLLFKNKEQHSVKQLWILLTSLLLFFNSGASSTDSDSESLAFKSKPGAMPQ